MPYSKLLLATFLLATWTCSSTVSSASTVKCGIAHGSSHQRIVGGRLASPHEFPWMVYIQMEHHMQQMPTKKLFTACDGTLIDDQWVVTAAHCFAPVPGYNTIRVLLALGGHNLTNRAEHRLVYAPKHIYRNTHFVDFPPVNTAFSKFDIAMVQLSQRINFAAVGNIVAPICLPVAGHTVSKTSCAAVGWGKTGPTEKPSPVLKVVDHNMMDAAECHHFRPEVDSTQVCAGYKDHSTCQGDSGGPLQCRDANGAYVLSGIVSYGDKICGGDKPAVFTNVESYLPFINEIRSKHH